MFCCRFHEKKSINNENAGMLSNSCKASATLSREKGCGKTKVHFPSFCKKPSNPSISANVQAHCSSTSDSSEQFLDNCCQNAPQPIKCKPCKMQTKNKLSTVSKKHQLNCICAICSACKNCCNNAKCKCMNSIRNTEKNTESKISVSHSKRRWNNTNSTEKTTSSNGSVPHTSCQHCHNSSNIKETSKEPERSIPHTDCNYCQYNTKNSERLINTNNIESKNSTLPHTDCKYCLNDASNLQQLTSRSSSESIDTSSIEEELLDEIPNCYSVNSHTCVPCSLHDSHVILDSSYLYSPLSYCQIPHRKLYTCKICQHPSFCLVNDDFFVDIKELTTNPPSTSLYELFAQNNTNKSIKLKSCEFCLQNGETPVIYNSHQFRNAYGIVTCPILRHSVSHTCGIIDNLESYPSNYNEIIAAINTLHNHNYSVPYAREPLEETINEMPCVHCLQNKPTLHENAEFSSTHYTAKQVSDDYKSSPILNQFDSHNGFLKDDHNTLKPHHRSNSTNVSKSKTNVSCQFCFTTGKPPFVYNSHSLSDNVGLKCPILKEHLATSNW